jgi:hypothetical protein
MLILACIFSVALTTTFADPQEYHVGAWLDRLQYYDTGIFDDSVSSNDELDGYRLRSLYIRPEGEFEVVGAKIEMETPFEPESFLGIHYGPTSESPSPFPDFTISSPAPYRYKWDWMNNPIPEASVGIHTNFPVTFQPGFDLTQVWDSEPITDPKITQTLIIEFTSSTEFNEFFNVHVSVQFPNTPEASPIDVNSISVSPSTDQWGNPWNVWSQMDGDIQVNWGGDPQAGVKYTFSVEVTVENKLHPIPVFYTPSVGAGANYDMVWGELEVTESVTIGDDMGGDAVEETSVTYSIKEITEEGEYVWQTITQKENSVIFPSYSAIASEKGHFWASFISTTGNEVWSNLFGFGHMSTPWYATIIEWDVDDVTYYDGDDEFSGTFTIEVVDQVDYITGGQITIVFDEADLERIPLITGDHPEPNAHIHFKGDFEISMGTGQYTGLTGEGEISGTIHLHEPIDFQEPYYDFVMMGEWEHAD